MFELTNNKLTLEYEDESILTDEVYYEMIDAIKHHIHQYSINTETALRFYIVDDWLKCNIQTTVIPNTKYTTLKDLKID